MAETGTSISHYKWKIVSKCPVNCSTPSCSVVEDSNQSDAENISYTFANCGEEEEIYLLTINEIADAQRADKALRKIFKNGGNTKLS